MTKQPSSVSSSRQTWWMLATVLVLGACAHLTTFWAPFIFDDLLAIRENPSITSLARMGDVLWPPANGSGASGRPLVNLSLALNYAVGGLDPRGYHLFNIVLHALVGGLLFALVRRLLRLALAPASDAALRANLLGWMVALLWAVHPLQTESVASVIQRTEILGGFFYLLTLVCFVRSLESPVAVRWQAAAVVACWAGMAAKETMFTAPFLVLLVDRALGAGSFRAAWRQRAGFYLGLASAWILLGVLVYKMGGTRGEGAGFGAGSITWWSYFLRQWEAIGTYLKLVVWPHPLIVDYGYDGVDSLGAVAGYGVVLVAAAVVTFIGLVGNRLWALPAAAFFLILGPSSSVMPLAGQTAAEHRMYLPLAAGLILLSGTWVRLCGLHRLRFLLPVCVFGLLVVSWIRNQTYLSPLALWRETIVFRPGNARAHFTAGQAAADLKRWDEAMAHYRDALRIDPSYAKVHYNWGVILADLPGRQHEAIEHYEAAVALQPDFASAHNNLAVLLAAEPGREAAALAHYAAAINYKPDYAAAHYNLASLLRRLPGRELEALAHAETAARLEPGRADTQLVLANALAAVPSRAADALVRLQDLVRRRPDDVETRLSLALLLAAQPDQQPEAIRLYEEALHLNPRHADAHYNLAIVLGRIPARQPDAIAHYEATLALRPDHAAAHNNLAQLLLVMPGREPAAREHFAAAVRLSPTTVIYRYNLGATLSLSPETRAAAVEEFTAALRLDPSFTPAADALRRLQ